MNELESWLFLARAPKISLKAKHKLLQHFANPQNIIESYADIKSTPNAKLFKAATAQYFKQQDLSIIAADLALLKKPAIDIIHIQNAQYPRLLQEIYDPPLVLFARGNIDLLTMPQISIVGSRNPDLAGKQISYNFAEILANSGVTITSGLALGIDAAAHRGALQGAASTIAVLGTGIDKIYPAKNKDLAHKIADNGLIISEFSAGTPPLARNFPIRNRLVSGLSLGTLVVQAKIKSGSFITARTAMEQGREVFAVPGSINNPLSYGCHHLIQQGVKLVTSVDDIFSEMSGMLAYSRQQITSTATDNLDYPILQYIGFEPMPLDLLPKLSGLDIAQINSKLIYLELAGKIEMLPGARVQKLC